MKMIRIIVCAVASAAALQSAEKIPLDGRTWKSASKEMKLGYVAGFRGGLLAVAMAGMYRDPDVEKAGLEDQQMEAAASQAAKRMTALVGGFIPLPLNFPEIVRALDRFYDAPENGPVLVIWAMRIVTMRVEGADTSKVEGVMRSARAYGRTEDMVKMLNGTVTGEDMEKEDKEKEDR